MMKSVSGCRAEGVLKKRERRAGLIRLERKRSSSQLKDDF